MSTGYTSTNITTGADVFGADGEKVGTVAAVYPSYIVVEKGFFFPTDYYIPMSAVASADSDQVNLNLAKDAALNSGWDAQPTDLDTASYDTSYDTSMATGATAVARASAQARPDSHRRGDPHPGHGRGADRHRAAAGGRGGTHRERRRHRGANAQRSGHRGASARRAAGSRPAGQCRRCGCLRGDGHRSATAHRDGRPPEAGPRRRGGRRQQGSHAAHRAGRGTVRREEVFVDEDRIDASLIDDRETGTTPTI